MSEAGSLRVASGAEGVADREGMAVATAVGITGCEPWLRTYGVNPNGVAAKIMVFDRLRKKVGKFEMSVVRSRQIVTQKVR